MVQTVIMPKLGQTEEESTVVKWHKREGELVKKGDILFEIETDKAVLEIESFFEGTLLKIVVAEGNISSVHRLAGVQMGAEGVIAIGTSRITSDPLQIPWSGISGRGETQGPAKFGFWLPFREGYFLKERLLRGDKITVHARVKAENLPYEQQDVTAFIPGTDPYTDLIKPQSFIRTAVDTC